MSQLLTGQIAWYVTGRFYSTGNVSQDVGYFLHIQGIDGNLFTTKHPSESTAMFTFSSEPFIVNKISNGDLSLSLDGRGEFSLYLNTAAGATFDNPVTFSVGNKIATFSRVSVVVGLTIEEETTGGTEAIASNAFSAALIWSTPFLFNGVEYDLKDILPNGITQFGNASALIPANPPHTSVVPFVGSAIAVGKGVA